MHRKNRELEAENARLEQQLQAFGESTMRLVKRAEDAEQLWKDCKQANDGLAEMHAKVVRLVTDHTLVSDGGLRHQLAQELGVQLPQSYWSSPARARCESLRAQLEAEKQHAAGVVAMNVDCIRDRDRARAALEAIRPVAAALDAWGNSWLDANSSPDPDDLPEEAALFEAWKAVASLKMRVG